MCICIHKCLLGREWVCVHFKEKKKKGFSTTLIIFVSVIIMEYSANILLSLVWSSDCLFSSHFGLGCSDDSDDNPTDLPFFSLSPLHSFSRMSLQPSISTTPIWIAKQIRDVAHSRRAVFPDLSNELGEYDVMTTEDVLITLDYPWTFPVVCVCVMDN